MSWDSYIEDLIARSKDAGGVEHIDKVCIIGLDGGAPWTTASHANALKLDGREGANITRCFKSGDFTPFMTDGVHAEGVHYIFLREVDDKTVVATCGSLGALTLQATKTAVIIARCPHGSQLVKCNKAVGIIAEYLEGMDM